MNNSQLSSIYEDPALKSSFNNAQALQNQAAVYNSAASLLPAKLKAALQEKADYNKDLIESKNRAMSEYFQAPSAAREKYGTSTSPNYVFNPMQQESLVARERTGAYENYANLVDILGQRTGTLADIVNAGVGAFQSEALSKQSAAQLAMQNYESLLGLTDRKADLAYKLLQLSKSSGGGTSGDRLANIERARLKADVASGSTFQDLVRRYGSSLTSSEIRQTYDQGSRYGAATEPEATVQSWLSGDSETDNSEIITALVNQVKSGALLLTDVPSEYRGEVAAQLGNLGITVTGRNQESEPWWRKAASFFGEIW